MGGYDSSQIADLVGLYILNMHTRIISLQRLGLYHNDGLLYIPNSNGPLCSSIQKRIIRALKFLGFKIEISSNIKIVNCLDVTLDLSNNSYKPFIKTNLNPSYININSNHPKNIYIYREREREGERERMRERERESEREREGEKGGEKERERVREKGREKEREKNIFTHIYIYIILHGTVCDPRFHAISNRRTE